MKLKFILSNFIYYIDTFCCMKLLFLMLFSLFLIPFVSITAAQNTNSDVITFIQIVQRDNDGNLIGYLEYDSVTKDCQNQIEVRDYGCIIVHNHSNFEGMLNALTDKTRIVEINGMDYELIQVVTLISTDYSGLLSTTDLGIGNPDGTIHKIISIAHDGIRLASDEQVTVFWNFLRPI